MRSILLYDSVSCIHKVKECIDERRLVLASEVDCPKLALLQRGFYPDGTTCILHQCQSHFIVELLILDEVGLNV